MKKKLKYTGSNCPYCLKEDIFSEWAHIMIVLEYAKKSHCCYNCAAKALQKNMKKDLQSEE